LTAFKQTANCFLRAFDRPTHGSAKRRFGAHDFSHGFFGDFGNANLSQRAAGCFVDASCFARLCTS